MIYDVAIRLRALTVNLSSPQHFFSSSIPLSATVYSEANRTYKLYGHELALPIRVYNTLEKTWIVHSNHGCHSGYSFVVFSQMAARKSFLGPTTDPSTLGRSGGVHLNTLTGHSHRVRSVAFSLDAAISGAAGKTLDFGTWPVCTFNTLTGHFRLHSSVAFSPDGTRLVSASNDEPFDFGMQSVVHLNTPRHLTMFVLSHSHPMARGRVRVLR